MPETIDVPILVKRCRGRQQARWKASCNRDIESVGLKVEDTMDTREWKGIKVVVAYWKVKTPCHAHGECIN